MARPLLGALLLRSVPPWLQRTHGARLLGGIGDVIDAQVQRAFEAVTIRFPRSSETTALPYIGRDRRIRRGPAEPASTYAVRLRSWWGDHQTRGGPHVLLRQLHAYLLGFAPGQIDLVYQSGTRFLCDETGAITRSDITWGGDGDLEGVSELLAGNASPGDLEVRPISIDDLPTEGRYRLLLTDGTATEEVIGLGTSTTPYGRILLEAPGVVGTYLAGPSTSVRRAFANWARIWIVVHLGDLLPDELLTESLEELLTEGGDTLLGDVSPVSGYSPADDPIWTAVARDWSAAHVQRLTMVLLFGTGELWDYPVPVGTWDESPTITWDEAVPIVITVED